LWLLIGFSQLVGSNRSQEFWKRSDPKPQNSYYLIPHHWSHKNSKNFLLFLKLVGCVFIGIIRPKQLCPVQQLFSIFCVNPLSIGELQKFFSELPSDDTEFSDLQSCSKGGDSSEASIGFDAVAFLFIIFQLRILHSWYFQRCMIEFRCEVIQANRFVLGRKFFL